MTDPEMTQSWTEAAKLALGNADLFEALAKAIACSSGVGRDAYNQHQRYKYSSAEGIFSEAREALAKNGLSLLPENYEVRANELGQRHDLVRTLRLAHSTGQSILLQSPPWPIMERKGFPFDKALAGAMTSSLRYLLRDLLLIPQVEESEEMPARDDRKADPRRESWEREVGRFVASYVKTPGANAKRERELVSKTGGDPAKAKALADSIEKHLATSAQESAAADAIESAPPAAAAPPAELDYPDADPKPAAELPEPQAVGKEA